MGRLRQDVHILVRDLGRDGRGRLVRLVLGAYTLARSEAGLTVASHVRSRSMGFGCFEGASRDRGSFWLVMSVCNCVSLDEQ